MLDLVGGQVAVPSLGGSSKLLDASVGRCDVLGKLEAEVRRRIEHFRSEPIPTCPPRPTTEIDGASKGRLHFYNILNTWKTLEKHLQNYYHACGRVAGQPAGRKVGMPAARVRGVLVSSHFTVSGTTSARTTDSPWPWRYGKDRIRERFERRITSSMCSTMYLTLSKRIGMLQTILLQCFGIKVLQLCDLPTKFPP